jgi:signal transduction histidine kinase/anti-sigma regulatory factor (Ser/Thr protein kinase)
MPVDGKKPVEVTFKPKARLIHLLGENLLRDEVTALLELVKNAYDADSPNCLVRFESIDSEDSKLIIEDEGTGMDISTVTTAWAEPGTSFKVRKPVTAGGRRVQGEKGIGRFAVDKLARRLDMFTKTKGMSGVIHFMVDWEEFDDADRYLEDVKAQYSFEKIDFKKHGTRLVLTKLRKKWTLADIYEARYGLTRLVPPSRVADEFVIDLQVPDYPHFGGIIRNDIIERAPFRISARLEGDEVIATIFRKLPNDKSQLKRTITVQDTEGEVLSERLKALGPVSIDIGAFLRTKHRGRAKQSLFPAIQISERDEKNLEQWHGVSIYSDGFWIYPYGETWFDWLGLAQRRVLQPGRKFDNNQLVGFVMISRDKNVGLVQQINREGLVHNESYNTLRAVVLSTLTSLEADAVASGARTGVKRATETEVASSSVTQMMKESFQDAEKRLKDSMKEVSEGSPTAGVAALQGAVSEIRSLRTEVERDFVIYERHAILGMFVANVIHEINMAIDPLRLGINTMENKLLDSDIEATLKESIMADLKEMDNDLDDFAAQVHRWTPFIQREETRQTVELCQYTREVISNLQKQYPELKFEILCRNPITTELATSYFLSIVRNLVDNSNYWTASRPERLVRITIDDDAERAIVRVSDNGRGIPDEDWENIFIPGWSSKPQGSGIGLKLAGEAATALGGELVLLHHSEMDKGASFELRLPLVKKDEP